MRKIKGIILTLIMALFAINVYSTTPVTVKVMGHYAGKDNDGKPICNDHPTHICIFKTYVIEDGYTFPMGIVSASYADPDTGTDIPFSAISQIHFSGGFKVVFTSGTGWTGPFSMDSSDWSF